MSTLFQERGKKKKQYKKKGTSQHQNSQSKNAHNNKKTKNKTIYILLLSHAFSHLYRILTIPPSRERCMCGEEEKHEERKKKRIKICHTKYMMISWPLAVTSIKQSTLSRSII